MKIYPTFTSNSFDNNSLQKSTSRTIKPLNNTQPNNSKSNLAKDVGLFVGLSIVAFGAFKGFKAIINTPSTETKKIIENKLANIKLIKNSAINDFINNLNTAKSRINDLFKKPISHTEDFSQFEIKIQNATSKDELIQIEDSFFETLNAWIEKNLNKDKKKPEELEQKYNEILKDLTEQNQKTEATALNKLTNQSELPEKQKKERRAKKAIETYNFTIMENKRAITEAREIATEQFKEEAQFLGREYNNYSNKIVVNKQNQSKNILELVEQKLNSFVNSNLPKAQISPSPVDMNVIPSTMPVNILNNNFYQFASSVKEKDLEKDIPDFVGGMNEHLNLKDIQTLVKRLEVRQRTSTDKSVLDWYEIKINQLKNCEAKISTYLENSFYNSGKNIDPSNMSLKQEESVIYALQQHAKKMGFESVSSMINYFVMGNLNKNGSLSNEVSERMNKYSKCTISQIYPKIIDKIDEVKHLLYNT